MRSLIENRNLFLFFIIKSLINSKFNILYKEIKLLCAKKLIALCEETKYFIRRNLIRYFLYLNCDSSIRRVRIKKTNCRNIIIYIFQIIIINKIFI